MLVYATNEANWNKRTIGQALPVQRASCVHPTICTTCNYFFINYKGGHKC